ncbi:hypothetical protein ANCDUO_12455 [Ancylostoma duodenale]|uniref:Reverse transcriptase domain-containing protein n=1 Tax=Ancylostoma duodenale TaxID=51022 RepID=A0A0C2G8W3_9BILA|nr:hypothetical protein ANCDUO_12455 [Ancylostoma duodenale]
MSQTDGEHLQRSSFRRKATEKIRKIAAHPLLPAIYEIFTKVLMHRIAKQLDSEQPREQAGFRSGYCTLNHLKTTNHLLERCRECTIPVRLVFVGFEKAFHSIEINAAMNALIFQNVPKKSNDWTSRGVEVDGERLHHLRFADDIALIAHDASIAAFIAKRGKRKWCASHQQNENESNADKLH